MRKSKFWVSRGEAVDYRQVNQQLENGNIVTSPKKEYTLRPTLFSRLGEIRAGDPMTLVAPANCGKSTFSIQTPSKSC